MAKWNDVMALDELAVGKQYCLQLDSRHLLICRTDNGVYAVENRCPHANFPLYGGQVSNDVIRCPGHGARFNLVDGSPVANPALDALETYPVEIIADRVNIRI